MINVDPVFLSATISDIYYATCDPSSWHGAIEGLRKLLHASKACVQRIGPDIGAADVVTTNPDPVFNRLFVEEHAGQIGTFTDAVSNTLPGAVYRDQELYGRDRFRRSRFWNDWMAPQDMYGGVGVKVLQDDASFWILDLQRGAGQDAFGANEEELFGIVAPHVMRALKINRNFQAMQSLASTVQGVPFGVVLVDQELRILGANLAAETLLARSGSKLTRMAHRLVVADIRGMGLLKDSVINVCSTAGDVVPGLGGDLLVRSGNEAHGDLAVSVAPLPGLVDGLPLVGRRAAVFVREVGPRLPAGFAAHLQSLFGLTPREAEVAVALASGLKLRTAAENAGIKLSTARAYLEKVFLKTGTHQQSQLVALLRSIVAA